MHTIEKTFLCKDIFRKGTFIRIRAANFIWHRGGKLLNPPLLTPNKQWHNQEFAVSRGEENHVYFGHLQEVNL